MCSSAAQEAPHIITLAGEFDIYTAGELADMLAQAQERANVVIDMTNVRYLDSTSLTVFIRMRKRRLEMNFPPCRLVGLGPNLRRLFKLTRLDAVWPIYETLDEAVRSFKMAS
jgi:anti-sigma B factor antagonist